MSIRQKKLPIAALERIDDLCLKFERSWQSGQPISIESILGETVPANGRELLLAELIVLDVDYRNRAGQGPSQREYRERFPNDPTAVEEAFRSSEKASHAFEPPTIARLAELFPALQIVELVGAGGMGAVYKVRQEGLDRIVALKVLPEEFGRDVKSALRFTREARTLAKLNHPNIVAVYEFGNVEETYYFLMEFVDGSTLRDVVSTQQLSPSEALAIVPHLCDALQYAHDQGVVHRDIKPENILMSTDGSVKIADFGLSRILGNESQQEVLTGTHQVMGTPRYMAPEQLEGAHGVDHRADIYSLGVVIYEMLTGELPIGRFAAPSTKVEIDVRLDEVVLRSLEKEPQRRYQRASQIKSDVQSITTARNPAFATTLAGDSTSELASDLRDDASDASLHQQDLAGRLLLTRRQLMLRVEDALRPLARGQILQIFIGIILIGVGARCWAPKLEISHQAVCGGIVHAYGLFLIVAAGIVLSRIKRIDYSKPVREIRSNLIAIRSVHLAFGPVIGFAWWLLWIPLAVAVGFDMVLYPTLLKQSVAVGIVGTLVSVALYARAFKSKNVSAEKRKTRLSGKSITNAYLALDEIESAQIQ